MVASKQERCVGRKILLVARAGDILSSGPSGDKVTKPFKELQMFVARICTPLCVYFQERYFSNKSEFSNDDSKTVILVKLNNCFQYPPQLLHYKLSICIILKVLLKIKSLAFSFLKKL